MIWSSRLWKSLFVFSDSNIYFSSFCTVVNAIHFSPYCNRFALFFFTYFLIKHGRTILSVLCVICMVYYASESCPIALQPILRNSRRKRLYLEHWFCCPHKITRKFNNGVSSSRWNIRNRFSISGLYSLQNKRSCTIRRAPTDKFK